MRLGLIARADSRGLGIQCKAFHDHMHPTKTMVVDCPSLKPLPLRHDWYPGATWIKGLPTAQDFRNWLRGLDVVYTAETGYNPSLWSEAERVSIETVLHTNFEFLDRNDRPTLWAAPSKWRYNEIPDPKTFLPVPVDLDRFTPNEATHATRFLHVIGRPAAHDRNGTTDLLKALHFIQSQITVTITCQEPGHVRGLARQHRVSANPNVTLAIREGDTPDSAELYRDQDVLVLPRRFGGLCLPAHEALAAGLPVVMPDIEPNGWLPAEWLVPAQKTGTFQAKTRIDLHATDPQILAQKIDHFVQDPAFFTQAQKQARELADGLSWQTLKPRYEKVLA